MRVVIHMGPDDKDSRRSRGAVPVGMTSGFHRPVVQLEAGVARDRPKPKVDDCLEAIHVVRVEEVGYH